MGETTGISWTDSTWSPLRAQVKSNAGEIARLKNYTSLIQIADRMAGHVGHHCEHASPGCLRCYSETNNARCLPANGTGLPFDQRSRDLVDITIDQHILVQPLRWKRPRRIFVESQSDLFGEFVPFHFIDDVFDRMMQAEQHVFQVLTKRAQRMYEYFDSTGNRADYLGKNPRIWLGVSVEDQQRADERIPWLLKTPAAVRFLSVEPLLGPVELENWFCQCARCYRLKRPNACRNEAIDWVIVGGESGPGARPMDIAWARAILAQCRTSGVPCFVKQLGAKSVSLCSSCRDGARGFCKLYGAERRRDGFEGHGQDGLQQIFLKDRKGGDMDEWPEDLRVREFPDGRTRVERPVV
jgi:protein gp37